LDFNLKSVAIKMNKLMRFLKDEEGVAAIEYGLIAALIAIVIIAAMAAISMFNIVATELNGDAS
jgi:pilus assembly protein Flp/PilA